MDDLGDLSVDNLTLPPTLQQQQQQQQLPDGTEEPTTTAAAVARSAAAAADAPATTSETELTVEALSVRDIVPVQQQQQQQQEGVDEELPAELQDVADVLRGAVAWREEQERMAGILEKLGKALLSISSAGLGVSVWGSVSLDVWFSTTQCNAGQHGGAVVAGVKMHAHTPIISMYRCCPRIG